MQKLPEKPPSDIGFSFDVAGSDVEFQKSVSEYNKRYLYWDDLRYRIEDPSRRKSVWAFMKMLRQMRYEHISFRNLDLKYSFIPEIVRGLHTIDRYLSGTIQIHHKAIRMEQSYIINSLMEEAISSSILEGAATTRKAAKEMLREGRKPKTHAEQMVVNNYEALRFILKKKDTPLTRELILDVQRIVTAGTIEEKYIGKFRTDNEIVVVDPATGLVYHNPPDFSEIDGFIGDFCTFANDYKIPGKEETGTFIHPVIKGILLHYLMGYYHPFNDGNGRTARTLFYWFVLSRGYWLFEYLPVSRIILKSRKNYGLAYLYTEYDENDCSYFLQYNILCIVQALDDLLKFLESKQTEQNATKAIIRKIEGINQRQADILREMMEHSDEYYSIRKIMQMYDVVYQTARSDLLDLEKRKFLMRQQRGREFLFIFNENSDLWKKKPEKPEQVKE
jgi:Fic family protein